MAETAQAAVAAPRVKIHLILNGYAAICSPRGKRWQLAVTTRGVFQTLLDDERCKRCAAALRRLEWNERMGLL